MANDTILYSKNSKGATKNLLELISEFIKVGECKISIQKLIVFLYTNNEMLEKFKESILFTILSKTVKYPGINLTKDVKDL